MAKAHPGRVGRRLAAIVAADVAGYSRLMGLDEVGTARTLRQHRKVTDALVAKHGGRIVKTTGDGVLLEFPSVVDAVECSVPIIRIKPFEPAQHCWPFHCAKRGTWAGEALCCGFAAHGFHRCG